jgi:hypothetical protein
MSGRWSTLYTLSGCMACVALGQWIGTVVYLARTDYVGAPLSAFFAAAASGTAAGWLVRANRERRQS